MSRRIGRVAPLAVALLVALAGCSAILDSGAGGDAATTTTTDTPTVAVEEGFDFPPGVSAAGLADPDALLRAHREAMAEEGFVYTFEHTLTEEDRTHDREPETTIDVSGEVRTTAGLGTIRTRRVDRDDDPANTTTVWYNGTVGARRVAGETTSYRTYADDPTPRLAHHYMVPQVVLRGDWELAEVREDEGLVVLRSHAAPEHGELRRFDAEMVVDARGRIRRLEARITTTAIEDVDGETTMFVHDRRVTFEVTRVGNVSLPPPDWLGEARETLDG